jgi:hypothetical protein
MKAETVDGHKLELPLVSVNALVHNGPSIGMELFPTDELKLGGG